MEQRSSLVSASHTRRENVGQSSLAASAGRAHAEGAATTGTRPRRGRNAYDVASGRGAALVIGAISAKPIEDVFRAWHGVAAEFQPPDAREEDGMRCRFRQVSRPRRPASVKLLDDPRDAKDETPWPPKSPPRGLSLHLVQLYPFLYSPSDSYCLTYYI